VERLFSTARYKLRFITIETILLITLVQALVIQDLEPQRLLVFITMSGPETIMQAKVYITKQQAVTSTAQVHPIGT